MVCCRVLSCDDAWRAGQLHPARIGRNGMKSLSEGVAVAKEPVAVPPLSHSSFVVKRTSPSLLKYVACDIATVSVCCGVLCYGYVVETCVVCDCVIALLGCDGSCVYVRLWRQG